MVNLRHRAKFRGDRTNLAEIWRFLHISRWGRRHLGFLKFRNCSSRYGQEGETVATPNFVAICQTVAEIWRFFDFSKMAAVHHLGFVTRMLKPPTEGIWWSLSLCKI